MKSAEYMRGRRNLHLRNAEKLDKLSETLCISRNAVVDLLLELYGEILMVAMERSRREALEGEMFHFETLRRFKVK